VFNAAKAITRGFEAELALRYHGLSLSGNYSRLDAKYKEFKLSAPFGQVDCSRKSTVGTVDLTCLPVEGAAKNQFSISGTYDLPLSENVGKISISANYAYIGSRYVSPLSLPELEIGATLEAVGLLNGSIAWDGVMGTPVDLRVFVTNLTNKTYRIGNTNVYTSLNYQSSIYGEPRMYGLQTKVHF